MRFGREASDRRHGSLVEASAAATVSADAFIQLPNPRFYAI